MIGEPVRRYVQRAQGAQAALAEGDARELGDVEVDAEAPLREGQPPTQSRVEGGAGPRAPIRSHEEVVAGPLTVGAQEMSEKKSDRAEAQLGLSPDGRPKTT